jgi:hypothetical protein
VTRPPEDRESRSKQGQWWQRWGQWLWRQQTTTETAGEGNNCKAIVAKDKLSAEGGLSDTNIILGWLYTFRTLTISLPDHKFIAWMAAIQKMITLKRSTPKDPDTTIRKKWDTWDYPLDLPLPKLPAIPSLPQHKAKVHHNQQDVCMKELELMKEILEKANKEST